MIERCICIYEPSIIAVLKNCTLIFKGSTIVKLTEILFYTLFAKSFLLSQQMHTQFTPMYDYTYSTFFQEFVKELNLKPGMRVLDIGCGIGGSAFYMARNFGAEVLGIDLSNNMLDIANERKMEMEENVRNSVSFRYLDATTAVFPANSFDVVYSRDAIMHILDKEPLYERILVRTSVYLFVFFFFISYFDITKGN